MNLKNKKVLITGGAGFIGSHLAEALEKKKAKITIIDSLERGRKSNLENVKKYIFKKIDLKTPAFAKLLIREKYDVIYHLAAISYAFYSVEDPTGDYRNGLEAAFNLLETARKNKLKSKIVFMSSVAVHGSPKKIPIKEDHPFDPIAPYGVTKLAVERYMAVYSKIYGIKTQVVRGFSFFGPRLRQQIIFDFICKLVQNPKEIKIIGDGTQERDILFVKDTARALIHIAEKGLFDGEAVNLGSGKKYSTLKFAKEVARALKCKPVFKFTGKTRPGDAQVWLADTTKLKKRTGFTPRYTLSEGIQETVDWYLANYESQA